ncbi:bifunctional sugar phosphate isomerase/epimerase/4-hydroxyphenylpyruvate dioxygenase family protein [Amycolatopsis anabasis]|uniref:bifunctional sugar phosphate isomerase/epimerase/4-hydroxyphenylpyruvate dioxygenase family protein n=1 Tax=Amycolatopsis anabasis TaxID=1840409 RepID=UPI00131C0017|nr:sugar phosphate isomerase/epimerase and 4-hydroxyphenylpyruvate domain-containing protein [Amycolatopsis anabasis]
MDGPELRLDIATVCLSGTLDAKLAAAAAAGFHGVEIFENDLIASSWAPREIRARCAELGLSIDLYQPFRDFEAVPPEEFAANLRRAEHKFDVMERLGADTMLVCSSVSPDAVDDDDLAAEQLHALASRAADRGIRIAYEALAWGRFVNTYEHSWRIVRRADHPALGLCLDSFHVLSRGSEIAGIRVIPGAKIFFLQLADAPRLRMDVLQWSRHHRLFPGQGAFDLSAFVAAVAGTGYDGPLSLEVFNDVFRQADPAHTAVDAMRSLLVLRESAADRLPVRIRDRIRVADLPAAPPPAGYAFAELTAPDPSGVLSALGFVHIGQHDSRPIQLWQQGDARITVRSGAGVRISALGVTAPDPLVAARRAKRLLASPLSDVDYDDPAVRAPDGIDIVFCPEGDWMADFTPPDPAAVNTCGITGIDHICLTEPFDDFDQTALFYRAVLGLEPEPETEFAAPYGLIRSRSASDRDRRIRIALNVAALRRGDWAPAVPDPQHVAFASEDAVASAEAMRALGAPLLDIPGNYYDDLDARFALPPERLALLRRYSVLYDRDEHGEFLHFYTQMLGSHAFFEVVQRIDGYAGYGTVNSPVRMAAHRQFRLARG